MRTGLSQWVASSCPAPPGPAPPGPALSGPHPCLALPESRRRAEHSQAAGSSRAERRRSGHQATRRRWAGRRWLDSTQRYASCPGCRPHTPGRRARGGHPRHRRRDETSTGRRVRAARTGSRRGGPQRGRTIQGCDTRPGAGPVQRGRTAPSDRHRQTGRAIRAGQCHRVEPRTPPPSRPGTGTGTKPAIRTPQAARVTAAPRRPTPDLPRGPRPPAGRLSHDRA